MRDFPKTPLKMSEDVRRLGGDFRNPRLYLTLWHLLSASKEATAIRAGPGLPRSEDCCEGYTWLRLVLRAAELLSVALFP